MTAHYWWYLTTKNEGGGWRVTNRAVIAPARPKGRAHRIKWTKGSKVDPDLIRQDVEMHGVRSSLGLINPLRRGASRTAVGSNISYLLRHPRELTARTKAGKRRQAIAIALSMQRKAMRRNPDPDLPKVRTHTADGYFKGSPMGRGTYAEDFSEPCRLRRVRLNKGGYDVGGAYWGGPDNLWLATNTDTVYVFVRASSRAEAKHFLEQRYPRIKWKR